jgi:type VI secretion system secreted protein VgrG
MPEYSQAQRPMRVDTVLDEDVLLLAGFSGSEAISSPFAFDLELLSEDPGLDVDAMLRTPVVLTIDLPDGEQRRIHGLVRRFSQLGQHDELTSYNAELVPWLWFLSLSRDCKIFQEMTVLDIVEEVFKSQGYSDFEIRCTRDYAPREYCVQYRETHFNFVSRLLEEEGIFYFFEHSESGHVLVLADSNSAIEPCPGPPSARMALEPLPEEDVVTQLRRERSVHVGMVTLRDYDYLQPSLELEGSIAGQGREEVYDSPGLPWFPGAHDDGDRNKFAKLEDTEHYARLQLEAEEALRHTVRGESSCRGFQSGCRFELKGHYSRDANQSYMLLQVRHVGNAGDYRSWNDSPLDYRNDFLAIPDDVPFHPLRRTSKPFIHGTQTAEVVGKAGEEVWVDKHGRIKVQFHWDRIGQRNEDSCCWVRVMTPWGGQGYGGVSIPRIGNEVVVAFLEGDPDRPLVTGSVYNAEQTPPFELPGSGIQMGMKSRSSPGGGGFNEITMTDTKGKEMMNIHAQYDMVTTVLHDDRQTVKNDRTITVEGNHTEAITKDCKISVDGTHTETIKHDTALTITEGDHTITVAAGEQTNTVDKDIKLTSKTTVIHLKAATEIKLEVGASSLLMKDDGTIELEGVNVSVKGTGVTIKGDANVTIKGGTVHSEADSQHQTKGAIVMSDGTATNTIKGGMVMLNP